MPYGVYKRNGSEEIRIYYSACEELLRSCEEESLIGLFKNEKDALFFASVEEDRLKYKGSLGPIEERARS